jgi:hypothetical protein
VRPAEEAPDLDVAAAARLTSSPTNPNAHSVNATGPT